MLVFIIAAFLALTGATSDDTNSPNCTFDWIVGGKSLELYEVDLPTKMSLVMEFDAEALKVLKVGLRIIEVLNRYVMGTPVVTANFVKSESGFENTPALTPEELLLLFASATDIGTPIPYAIQDPVPPVKAEPLERSRRFTQEMQEQFDELLSNSPTAKVIPVLENSPEMTKAPSPTSDRLTPNVEDGRDRTPTFDPNLSLWDNTESNTLRILRESKDPMRWIRYSRLMFHLATPEYEPPAKGNLREELSRTIERSNSRADSPARPFRLFEMDEGSNVNEGIDIREQNTQYNQDIERAYAESVPAGGANAIPCETEKDVSSNFIPRQEQRTPQQRMKSHRPHRPCKKTSEFSYDETVRRRKTNKDRQAESRQQELQKQRQVRDTESADGAASESSSSNPNEPPTETPAEVRARVQKKTQFNMFGKTYRKIKKILNKCDVLVKKLESVKIDSTLANFPTHKDCFTEYKLSYISEDVNRMAQEKSYSLRYFAELIAKFVPQNTPDSQDVFLSGIGLYLLSELHGSLDKFITDIYSRLSFFVNLAVQVGNRDLSTDVGTMLTNSPCAGGLHPEDVKISSVRIYQNGIEGIYELSPIKQVKTYRRLQSVPYPVPGTNEYVYIYFDKDEYYDTSAPLIGSTSSCEQVSKSYYCRSSTIVPNPHACMVALWYDSWDNIKENCNVGYKSQVNTPLTVSTSLGLLMADRSNVRSIKLHQALGSNSKDYIVENPVIVKFGGTITTNYGRHYQNFSANSGGDLKICTSTVTASRITQMRKIAKNMDVNDHFRTIRTFIDKYGWYLGIGSIIAAVFSLLNCLICCGMIMFKCKKETPKFKGGFIPFMLKPRRSNIEETEEGGIEMVPDPEEQERLLRGNVDVQMRNLEIAKANRDRRVRMNLEPRMSM